MSALLGAAMASLAAMSAHAQSPRPPQPAPRPRESKPPAPPPEQTQAPESAQSPAPDNAPPPSRQELRALQRACAQEWSRRKMAGQTGGQIWIEFFDACSKRR